MRAALTRYDPSFTTWRDRDYLSDLRATYDYSEFQAPFAVLGDFNGDGVLDAILDGRTERAPVVLALLSTRGRYDAIEIARHLGSLDPSSESYGVGRGRYHYGRPYFLRPRINPGRVDSGFLEKPIALSHHAFAIEFWEKAATLYVWQNGTFEKFIIAD